ncbi:hypothetical protein sos41_39620 [Alphaproteobacteria bacterium SO-S41]|nr:hypothetical protein sos41_39620 [Alphaproteobacteria bacterium SO-S41]
MVDLAARSAFDGLLLPIGTGQGVTVHEPAGLGVATILAGPDRAAFAARVRDMFAATLSSGSMHIATPAISFLGTSRNVWLAVGAGGSTFAADLARSLAGVGEVADQSGAYGILDLTGPNAMAVLAKGLPIDLDSSAFAEDAVAVSHIEHIGVIVWRIPGGFRLATPRSSAASFWHWLSASAAEYELGVA